MANVSGASLSSIYERLNSASAYHPMEAETFSDWSMEAGDIVTVSRGEEEYQSPIHTTRMVWKGSPQTTISSSGKKERESVAKASQRKYGRGGAGMRNQQGLYYDIYSEDGELHSVIQVTASSIRTEVGQTISGMAHSIIEQTATYIRTEVENAASAISSSVIEQTAEYVRTEVASVASGVAWSVVEQTMTGIFQEVAKKSKVYRQWTDPNDGVNELHDGDIWIKTGEKRTWDELATMKWNEIAEHPWNAFYGAFTYVWKGTSADGHWQLVSDKAAIEESRTWVEQSSEQYSILAHQLDTQGNAYDANLSVTAQKISSDVTTAKGELYSTIAQTATNINLHVENVREGLQSNIEQTAQSITLSVSAAKSSLYSTIQQTATNIRSEVANAVSGLQSSIEQTAQSITTSVSAAKSSLYSAIQQTATQIRTEVANTASGLRSSITQNANKIALVVDSGNNIKAAQIVASINDGASSIIISANHINLDGYVKASDLTTNWLASKIALISRVDAINIQTGGLWLANGTTPYGSTNYENIKNYMMTLRINGPSGNVYTLQKKSWTDSDWQDVGSFSRAISTWTWGGGSGYINVTALPQSQTKSVKVSIDGTSSITANGTYTYNVDYENGDGDDLPTGASKTVTVNVPSTGVIDIQTTGYSQDGQSRLGAFSTMPTGTQIFSNPPAKARYYRFEVRVGSSTKLYVIDRNTLS